MPSPRACAVVAPLVYFLMISQGATASAPLAAHPRTASQQSRRSAMLIVSGRIYVHPGTRQAFLTASLAAVVQARSARCCRALVVVADALDSDRIHLSGV